MKRYITLFGAWSILFPVNFILTVFVVSVQLFVKIFNLPFDVWNQLDEELNNLHIEDE